MHVNVLGTEARIVVVMHRVADMWHAASRYVPATYPCLQMLHCALPQAWGGVADKPSLPALLHAFLWRALLEIL